MKKINIIWLLLFLNSCQFENKKNVIITGVHHWNTTWIIGRKTYNTLSTFQHLEEIYVHLFDIDYFEDQNKIIPSFKLDRIDSMAKNYTLKPIIYITQQAFNKILERKESEVYTHKISKLVMQMCDSLKISFENLYVDFDWNSKTEQPYFDFINQLKKLNPTKNIKVTLRLHQLKTKPPPTTEALLMCYNMGNLKQSESKNSIFQSKDFQKYSRYLKTYPLDLEFAIPAFSWILLFRNNQFQGILSNLEERDLINRTSFQTKNENMICTKPIKLKTYTFKVNDVLRIEKVNLAQYQDLRNSLNQYKKNIIKISIFDTKSLTNDKKAFQNIKLIF